MTTSHLLLAASAAALLSAGAVRAQTSDVFDTEDLASDRVEDLEEDIQDDFERELDTRGNVGRPLGFTGSFSLRATATSGNTDTADLGIGTRLGWFDGVNGQRLTLSYTYGEDESETTENSLIFGYDYTRDLTPRIYGFARAAAVYDEFGSYESDVFVGAGVGYRIYDMPTMQWTVQAGPGYRMTETQDGMKEEEAAASISSDYLAYLSDTMFVTNDTDILYSDTDTYVTNELGLNVSMTDALALRTSLLTEYHTDPEPGFDDTDNTLGVSVVYTFQ